MNVLQSMRVAMHGLTANKMRSFLTMLGIIIGVAAVIALLSVGHGVQVAVTEQIQSTGSNLITIVPGALRTSNVRYAVTGGSTQGNLTSEDADALANAGLPSVALVAAEFSSGGQVIYGSANTNGPILGVTPEYLDVRTLAIANGDFINMTEVESLSRVAVLGAKMAETLFADEDPIGQTIKINRINFRVIGVLEAKGGSGFSSVDNSTLIPVTTAQRRLFGGGRGFGVGQRVSSIYVSAASEELVDSAINEITEMLRELHKIASQEDDFTVISQKQILEVFSQVTGLLTAFLGAIAAISLLVGGIGIMNIMLVSVSERTREIGIRKAVGAKRRDILSQFLVEAISLSLFGGVGGIGLGWLLGQIINGMKIGDPALVTVISPDAVMLAVGFSVAVGLFFGIYPATRAGALNPIDALRYE